MAKDKSKNKDKSEKSSKAEKGAKPDFDNDGFGRPSDAPAGGDGWRFEDEDNIGKLFLISPLRVKDDAVGFENKVSEVIVADIVELNEKKPEKSEEHAGAFVWGGWTKGSLRGYVGERRVLARLEQDKSKGRGKNAAWVLVDADSKAEIAAARAYLESVISPLGGSSSSDDDDAKSEKKKGKKKK